MAISVRAPEGGLAAVPALTTAFVVPAFNEADNILRLFSDLEQHPHLFGPDSRLLIVDDGSPTPPPSWWTGTTGRCRWSACAWASTRARARRSARGFREALDGSDDDEFLIVTLEADTTSDLARCRHAGPRPRTGPTWCWRPCTAAARWSASSRCAACSAPAPASRCAAPCRSTRAPCRPSSGSTARRRCGAASTHYGDDLHPRARLRLQGRAPREARRARRVHRGGPDVASTRRAAWVPARCASCRRWPPTGAWWLASAPRGGRRSRDARRHRRAAASWASPPHYRLAQAGVQVDVIGARRRPRRPDVELRLRRPPRSIASTTWCCRPTTACSGWPRSSASATSSASARRASASRDGERLFSMSSPKEFLTLPAAQPVGAAAARRVRRALQPAQGPRRARRPPLVPWLGRLAAAAS